MKKQVKLFLSAAALAGMTALIGAGSAEAGSTTGKVTYISDYGAAGYAYVYVRPLSLGTVPSTAIGYCKTVTAAQMSMAAAAAAGNVTVKITGPNAVASGYLGTCTYVDTLASN